MGSKASGFTVEQENLIWDLHRRGESLGEIERFLGVTMPRIRRFLRESSGIRPVPRARRIGHITAGEREEVSRGIASGDSARTIAEKLRRSPSTIARAIARNGGREHYRAMDVDAAAYVRARRPKISVLCGRPILRTVISEKLHEQWSPQQISVWLRRENPADPQMWVSHEMIYRCLYIPVLKAFDSNVFHELRTDRPIRRPRGKKRSHGRGRIRNMVSIDRRGAAANDRSEPGHLEGDLVFGTRPSAVATLVDRHSRSTHVVALPDGYRAETVADALIAYPGRLPTHLRRSLTWDRGREMAEHERITVTLEMPVYFCAPHPPWQRGTNENTVSI
ncbi:IS30 family transposase [Rhodococcus globerulus]|uniref:IS30 family transposase n=1 Tax=Rhodococcus globerulus TaxID=33008 RepID=A0ABU4C435_RHOGO|nr:IS30 family transposase [Rhodococcus globerulus]MDV6271258.1 IS30 family transposase [Rhodococcus globerulus]